MNLTPAFWRVFRIRFLTALVAAFAIVVGSIVVLNNRVDASLGDIARIHVRSLPEGPAEGGNYLLIGSDTRAFVENEVQEDAFGSAEENGGKRSDTIMVLHVDPERKTNLLVSFPRDLLVDIPGQGVGQINSTFNSGPELTIRTLKDNFNLDINHYVEVDFQAFIAVVDAVGKIPVYFPGPARDEYSGLIIGFGGCTELDGNQALAYVRSRSLEIQDPDSGRWRNASPRADIDRIGRQQDFIRKLANKASERAGQNPLKAIEIADAVVTKLTIDDNLSKDDILRLVKTFRNVDPAQEGALEMVTLPWAASTSQPGRLVPQQPEAEALMARMRTFGGDAAPKARTVTPVEVTVTVLNGTGQDGAAGTALGRLQELGFSPGSPADAAPTPVTLVRYAPDQLAKAELVRRYLGGAGQLIEDPSFTDTDVTVVIGDDWRGVHARDKVVKPVGPSSTTTPPKSSGKAPPAAPAC